MPPYGYVWLRPGLLPPARRKPCTGKPWSARCDSGRAPVHTWSKRQRCGTAHWLPHPDGVAVLPGFGIFSIHLVQLRSFCCCILRMGVVRRMSIHLFFPPLELRNFYKSPLSAYSSPLVNIIKIKPIFTADIFAMSHVKMSIIFTWFSDNFDFRIVFWKRSWSKRTAR